VSFGRIINGGNWTTITKCVSVEMRNSKHYRNVFALIIMTLGLLVFSCEEEETGNVISVSSGTSFGECMGYCVRTLEIENVSLTYTVTGYDPVNYPVLTVKANLSSGKWNTIAALVDFKEIQSYEDVIGCPDCADGGAEWIQVETGDGSKKITFEYGDTLETIQPLIDHLRTLRAQYESQLFAE